MMRSDFRSLWDSAPMMVHTFPAIQYLLMLMIPEARLTHRTDTPLVYRGL